MPSAARKLALDQSNDLPLYTKAELIDLRRTMLLYARFFRLDMNGTKSGRSRSRCEGFSRNGSGSTDAFGRT
jgi:hypothetical protein